MTELETLRFRVQTLEKERELYRGIIKAKQKVIRNLEKQLTNRNKENILPPCQMKQ